MGSISLQIPLSGQPNATEDPKVASDFTTIQTVINGGLDSTNLSGAAAIAQSQLAIGAWTPLTITASPATPGTGDRQPSVRVYGDVAYLRGWITFPSGFTSGASFATLPGGSISSNTIGVPALAITETSGGAYSAYPMFLNGTPGGGNNGLVVAQANVSIGGTVYLDGIQYMLT